MAVQPIAPTMRIVGPGTRPATEEMLLALHRKLRNIVASKLIRDWSPEQISGWLKEFVFYMTKKRKACLPTWFRLQTQARTRLKKQLYFCKKGGKVRCRASLLLFSFASASSRYHS